MDNTQTEIPKFTNNSEIKTPKYVGGYNLNGCNTKENGLVILQTKKPFFFHRFFCKVILGFIWVDYPLKK